ncbi:MAG: IS701 family transposase [Epsilonproteobacteria bacterium]|nr:MAG: IS701 family transposase [Campylobacterota bacterium]
MKTDYIELYTDYLISSNGYATATGLSAMTDNKISHDQITRFLSKNEFGSKELWLEVKSTMREIESEEGCLIFDDTVQEKKWTDESDIMCWHFDHTVGKSVRGINMLNALYYSNETSIPLSFEIVKKYQYSDIETREVKRKAVITKNELMREMILTAVKNQVKFKYVLMDSWFGAKENFEFIVKYNKEFISAIKSNRLIALSLEDKKQGKFIKVDELKLSDKQSIRGYLRGYDKEILLVRRIFTNKDGSTGVLNMVCSEITLDGDSVSTIYEKRWKVEEFYKSLKHNVDMAKSPTKTIRTQSNHIFLSILSFFKLERLKIKHKLNHFALRMKLLIKANQMAYEQLQILKGA